MIEILRKYKLGIIALFILLIIFLVLIIQTSRQSLTKSTKSNKTKITLSPTPASSNTINSSLSIPPYLSDSKEGRKIIAKVGDENIYQNDLNKIITTRFPKDITSRYTKEEIIKRALNESVEESILLQEENKIGGVSLLPPIFNTDEKNYILRQKVVEEIKNKRLAKQERISGAFISIWYHNVRPPSIPPAEAQKLALGKIQKIYNDLKTGKISFETGGQIVKNDTSLAAIDKSYTGNAYYEFKDRASTDGVFVFNDLEDKLWTLNEGEISEIIQHPSSSILLGKEEEEFYGIIKVTKRTNTGSGSYKDWLKKVKQNYEISVY